jgi:hypothetical protein
MTIRAQITKAVKLRDEEFNVMATNYFSKKMKTAASRKKFFASIGGKTDRTGKLIIGR